MRTTQPGLIAMLVAAMTTTAAAQAEGWNCRNLDLEVTCAETCEVYDSHTPMDVFVSPTEMTVCAYSGCWEGVPNLVHKSGSLSTFIGEELTWTGGTEGSASASVSIDTEAEIATILIPGLFATPATCSPIKTETLP